MIQAAETSDFNYRDERFADLQLLRYQLKGFESLAPKQKELIYYLSKATLYGRDITFDQFGKYNLRIRKMMEVVFTDCNIDHDTEAFQALEVYLKRIWFSNGIYHHYGSEKMIPGFSPDYLCEQLKKVDACRLPLRAGETLDEMCDELFPVIFDPLVLPKRVNKADGDDLIRTSACHFYEGVTQAEAEAFYEQMKKAEPEKEGPKPDHEDSTEATKETEKKDSEKGKKSKQFR